MKTHLSLLWLVHHVFLLMVLGYDVYEFLQNCFIPNDSTNGFNLFFKLCAHITQGHVPLLILCLFSAFWLLVLKKQYGSICPIVIDEVTYPLIACTLVIYFIDIFTEHFSLHQFGVTICGGCDTMVYGVWVMLDLHPYWMVLHVDVRNAFYAVLRLAIFQELCFLPNF